jgi:hypothetical protein
VGYRALNRDVILDKQNMLRSVKRAFLDHLALTVEPVYESATVLSVRSASGPAADLPPMVATPVLDDLVSWMRSRKG